MLDACDSSLESRVPASTRTFHASVERIRLEERLRLAGLVEPLLRRQARVVRDGADRFPPGREPRVRSGARRDVGAPRAALPPVDRRAGRDRVALLRLVAP